MNQDKQPAIYMLSNHKRGTIYIGVTSNLIQRVYQHKAKLVSGFTKQYNLTNLVWYEVCDDMLTAIAREKQLKKWRRSWKIELIEKNNPNWDDLYELIL